MNHSRQLLCRLVVPFLLMAVAASAPAQIDDKCTVSVLNRNAPAAGDGTWILPTVPANFGPVRARATCVHDGVTTSGESPLFSIPADGSVDVPAIVLGATTPIPQLLTVTAPVGSLHAAGAATQLTVVATFAGNTTRNVTQSTSGTTYTISNPAIATITAEGVITAVSSGTALVQATNEGTSGLLSIAVVLSADSDGDGIPDDVELREGLNPNNPTDALEDADRDGLSNLDEYRLGTDLLNRDSDGDGISDGEEVVAGADGFITNPLLADTDGDGLRDALEIATGSDPTNASSYNLSRALTSIEVNPPLFTLIVNTVQPEAYTQLRVTGHLRDGNTIDLTSTTRGTNYTSSNVGILNFGSPDGRVYAASPGSGTITVANSGFSASVTGAVRNFTPVAVSRVDIPGYANNVDVADGIAYVAAGSAGLQVVDAGDPAHPLLLGSLDTSGNANDVKVVGRYAYVADGFAGLRIIDVVDPAHPVLVGTAAVPGEASDVVVVDNIAYLACGSSGLVIVNVASPSAPILVSQLRTPGYARGVDVVGTTALVADDSNPGLRVINVANPAAPVMTGSVALTGEPKDVRGRGTLAYVAAYTGGLQIVDFSDAAAPRVIGTLPNQFYPFDVALSDRLALFADVLFVNAVPVADISDPTAPILRGSVDFRNLGDYNGSGIAISGPYVYMTGIAGMMDDNGTDGTSALFIGQYLPLEDLAGVPPQVTITAPAAGQTLIEGSTVTIAARATDDVAVAFVTWKVDDQPVFTDTSGPFQYTLHVPAGQSSVKVTVVATDLAGSSAEQSITFPVIPDPLTTVSGIVVDENGAPLLNAAVTTLGGRSAITGAGGTFSIYGVPTARGDLVAAATFTRPDGTLLSGSSRATTPVPSGVTNVGTFAAVSALFETNYGTYLTNCDDCSYSRTLPFSFPFYGRTFTSAYVGTNGYITFDQGDSTYVETLPAFNGLPRIAGFFDDLYGRSTGAVYVNDQLPGRFIVTYDRVQHYNYGGSNTLQITLFADGRIQYAYRGITAIDSGTIVGITPGPNSQFQQVDYDTQTTVQGTPDSSIYEYFTSTNLFDLDGSFIIYTPRPDNSYSVRTVLAPPPATTVAISGAPVAGATVNATSLVQASSQSSSVFGNAEVEVRSSGNAHYRALTNTNAHGAFTLSSVPPGGIFVTLRKKGRVIGYGTAVVRVASDKNVLEIHSATTQHKPNGTSR